MSIPLQASNVRYLSAQPLPAKSLGLRQGAVDIEPVIDIVDKAQKKAVTAASSQLKKSPIALTHARTEITGIITNIKRALQNLSVLSDIKSITAETEQSRWSKLIGREGNTNIIITTEDGATYTTKLSEKLGKHGTAVPTTEPPIESIYEILNENNILKELNVEIPPSLPSSTDT